jgi:hypothetical protein
MSPQRSQDELFLSHYKQPQMPSTAKLLMLKRKRCRQLKIDRQAVASMMLFLMV